MKLQQKRRQQPRLPKGERRSLSSGVERQIRKAVEREALRFNCTMSFVVKVAVADALGVDIDQRYDKALK